MLCRAAPAASATSLSLRASDHSAGISLSLTLPVSILTCKLLIVVLEGGAASDDDDEARDIDNDPFAEGGIVGLQALKSALSVVLCPDPSDSQSNKFVSIIIVI